MSYLVLRGGTRGKMSRQPVQGRWRLVRWGSPLLTRRTRLGQVWTLPRNVLALLITRLSSLPTKYGWFPVWEIKSTRVCLIFASQEFRSVPIFSPLANLAMLTRWKSRVSNWMQNDFTATNQMSFYKRQWSEFMSHVQGQKLRNIRDITRIIPWDGATRESDKCPEICQWRKDGNSCLVRMDVPVIKVWLCFLSFYLTAEGTNCSWEWTINIPLATDN